MYAQLFASGQLHDRAEKAARQTDKEYQDGITNGMLPHESWEAVRENHIFLPAEYDVPNLGETSRGGSEPEQEETATGEFFELYKELCDLTRSQENCPLGSASRYAAKRLRVQHITCSVAFLPFRIRFCETYGAKRTCSIARNVAF
jgi:hypothetical protein